MSGGPLSMNGKSKRLKIAALCLVLGSLLVVLAGFRLGLIGSDHLAPDAPFRLSRQDAPVRAKGPNIHLQNAEGAAGGNCDDCHFGPQPTQANPAVRASTKTVCLQCHAEIAEKTTARYLHQPLIGDECTFCHRVHSSEFPYQLVSPPADLCGKCHEKLGLQAREPSQHAPFASGECGGCHDAHGANQRKLIKAEAACWSCHEDVARREEARPYKHEPFARGDCSACHLPHSARYPGLLVADVRTVCFTSCHQGATMELGHTPAARGQCTSCHRPHASDYPALLVADGRSLCLTCHRK